MTVLDSIFDNMAGVTLGPSAMIFGVKAKFQWGPGIPGFTTGPYIFVTLVMSTTRGSVLGAPLAECKGATLTILTGLGAGLALTPKKLEWLVDSKSILAKYLKAKVEDDIVKAKVVDLRDVQPEAAVCGA